MIVCANAEKAIIEKQFGYMASSSITKNFVISGKEQVRIFVNAIEARIIRSERITVWKRKKHHNR